MSIAGSGTQNHLETLLKCREPYHKKYMRYSAYWVPISCLFVIVPLIPNIPLAYNLFRLYSHYKGNKQNRVSRHSNLVAYKGAQHLRFLAYHSCIHYAPSPDIDRLLESANLLSSHDVKLPDVIEQSFLESQKKPKLSPLQDDIDGVLDKRTIAQLAIDPQVRHSRLN